MHAFKDKSEAAPANLQLQETIGDIDVYGDGRIRSMWRVQRLAVWLEYGPSSDAVLPQGDELRALVKSSDSVEYNSTS